MKIGNPADKSAVSHLATTIKLATDSATDVKHPIKAGPQVPVSAPVKDAPISLSPDASATVALSSTASSLLSSSTGAEFDSAKVAKISGAIADGTFKINAGAIADKLISNAQELLAKVGS